MKPKNATTTGRTILAVLAGAICAPVFVLILMMTSYTPSEPSEFTFFSLPDFIGKSLLFAAISIIFGGHVALIGILLLFGPLWYLHRHFNGGPLSFIALAAVAGFLLNMALWRLGSASRPPDPMFLWIYPVAAGLSGGVMWLVGYFHGPIIADTRAMPQANFTGDEPST